MVHTARAQGCKSQWLYKYTGKTPLNIPSSPDPFALGLHALPLGLLHRACTQSGADEFTREEGSAAYIHTRLIN